LRVGGVGASVGVLMVVGVDARVGVGSWWCGC
jgi:hypothetical protein